MRVATQGSQGGIKDNNSKIKIKVYRGANNESKKFPRTRLQVSGKHPNQLIANFKKRDKQGTIEYHLQQVKNFNLKWRELPLAERHAYCKRLSKLQGKGFGIPRVFDGYNIEETLKNKMKYEYLHDDGDVFVDYSWERALSIYGDVYSEWCLEFFSMIYFDKGVDRTKLMTKSCIWFRLYGVKKVLTLPEFMALLGLYEEDELNHGMFATHFTKLEVNEKLFNHEAFWQKIRKPTSTNPRTSLIKEPLMRIVHKLLVVSLVHRAGNKERCQKRDMWIMSALEESRGINLAWIIAEHLAASGLRPYHFTYPERRLTMEEMFYKFIDEGKREHKEMRAFIYCEVKGVTTRGGKTTTQDNNADMHTKDLLAVNHDNPVESNKVLTNDQPLKINKPVVHPSSEIQAPRIPFPHRLRKKEEAQQKKSLENLKQLHINLPFIKALSQMPKHAKFLKGLLKNKARLKEACMITMNERCSAMLLNKLPSKEKDPGSFTIPCDIVQLHINNALADLGASISLMPYTMYEKLGLGEPKATRMSLEPTNRVPIILGRLFLATARAMIDVFNKKIMLRVGDDEVIFDVDQSIKRPSTEDDECYRIDYLDDTINTEAQELLTNDESDLFLLRGLEKSINQSDLESCESFESKRDNESEEPIRHINLIKMPNPIAQETAKPDNVEREYLYSASANEIHEKKPELKNLPHPLEYAYLHGDKSFPIIILSKLSEKEKILLLQVLEKRNGAIA
nr:hypothetical protein [Tanacetum cinerariifolium]